jgi:hypothetical protein
MRRFMSVALALVGVGALVSSVQALMIAIPPGPQKFLNAGAVVVGRVTGMEPTDVDLNGAKYRVAVLQVSEVVTGVKADTKSIRIGFIVPNEDPKAPRISRPPVQVQVGQDGLFILSKFSNADMYMAPGFGFFVPAAANNFKSEIADAKKAAAISQDPVAAIKSKDARDQMFGLQVLVNKYRSVPAGLNVQTAKQEPIDAEESKLILKTIAAADWKTPQRFGAVSPIQVWMQLGITAKDGWTQPKQFNQIQFGESVQEWVRANGETYRIQRFVAPDNTK